MSDLKVLLAPMNFANMPVQIVRALRRRGITAEHVQYSMGRGHAFGYELDREINIHDYGGRIPAQAAILQEYIERDFNLFHFWNKSLFFHTSYSDLTGFDLPLLKARGKHILFRFSGFDLRLPSWDLEVNPHSPFRHGYEHKFDEDLQKAYIDFLGEYIDQFLVQDPELQQFFPQAKIIPRAVRLGDWDFVGIEKTDRPLILHAPSDPTCKGSQFVMRAIDSLRDEGLSFDFKLIENMPHAEAVAYYKKADIIVDQLLIGATGVLTLEAWALGKPVVVYLREDLFKPFYKTDDLPVANANPDTITDVLRRLIKDYEWRQHLSKRGRETVEAFHNIDQVVDQFIGTYETVRGREPIRPSGSADVRYLKHHAEAPLRLEEKLRQRERRIEILERRFPAPAKLLADRDSPVPEALSRTADPTVLKQVLSGDDTKDLPYSEDEKQEIRQFHRYLRLFIANVRRQPLTKQLFQMEIAKMDGNSKLAVLRVLVPLPLYGLVYALVQTKRRVVFLLRKLHVLKSA